MEHVMMDTVLNCGANGWLMLAAGVLIYGTLTLAGAALIKYLFFAYRSHTAG
jgi:hypothetical protein